MPLLVSVRDAEWRFDFAQYVIGPNGGSFAYAEGGQMRSLRLWLILALAPWLAGFSCPTIYSEQPLGEPTVLDPQKLNGLWIGPSGEMQRIRVLDGQKGKLVVWSDTEGHDTPSCEPPQKALRVCSAYPQACLVRSVAAASDATIYREGASYYFEVDPTPREGVYETDGVALSDGNTVIIVYWFVPQEQLSKRLTALVQTGALPGRVESSGRVVLGQLTAEHYRLILSEEGGVVYWMSPYPFIKLPDKLDPCKKGEQ